MSENTPIYSDKNQPQDISVEVLREKYAKGTESSIEEVRRRVAKAVASNEKDSEYWEQEFMWAQNNGFIPAGRINSAAGVGLRATLINCFVQPISDSISERVNGRTGIYPALEQAAETLRRGGGVGYNFTHIRPYNAKVKGTNSHASGPLSYMEVYDSSCKTVESAGSRRGAQMGVLNVYHPDIERFITAKQTKGALENFNVSVGVTDAFMTAVKNNQSFELYHEAEPIDALKKEGAYLREDGMWVYRSVSALELWELIMKSTYDYAEPGVLFLDRINSENNLWYCETIEATNPCGEQPLPDYGCCCLGSVNMTAFVVNPFGLNGETPFFDIEKYKKVIKYAVRMLDNVLDVTTWPLDEQFKEAMNKRRIGLGFTGLGNALTMLKIKYDSAKALELAAAWSEIMRDAAYLASAELAVEKGAFPLFDAAKYLESGFAKRLPEKIRRQIREGGIRNSHLTSIAPTGTISLAFADNASNGIEPSFSWSYLRHKREADGSKKTYAVEDHAFRKYRELGGDTSDLPDYFVNALEISAINHEKIVNAVAPFIDAAISKTVNVPADYPFEEFKDLYMIAWQDGLKGITTYRPSGLRGAVLEVTPTTVAPVAAEQDLAENSVMPISKADSLMALKSEIPPLASLRWPGRPALPAGAAAWVSDTIRSPLGNFVVSVSDKEGLPFEVWVLRGDAPRGLDAVAKTLSMDIRSNDKNWVRKKLSVLARTMDEPFVIQIPPQGQDLPVPGAVAALARLVSWRCGVLNALTEAEGDETPISDSVFSDYEPKTGPEGTMSWVADVVNPSTEDEFKVFVTELTLADGTRRPYGVYLAGNYPKIFDALCKLISLDMRVMDVSWVAAKLRKLLDYAEPRGDFMAKVPGSAKQANFASSVAYMAKLILSRYAALGLLDEEGYPAYEGGSSEQEVEEPVEANRIIAGKKCNECGVFAVIKLDGCERCTSCGATGSCG